MTSCSFQIGQLLEKMTSTDKDFRFMATNDLMAELQKDSLKLDDDAERKIIKMLLKLLEDKNGEVQNLAVKCLLPLLKKLKDFQVEAILKALCENMGSSDEQLRDISCIGLKSIVSGMTSTSNTLIDSVCKILIERINITMYEDDTSVKLEAFDILLDLLPRYGTCLQVYHPEILRFTLPLLVSPRQAIRKRAINVLSMLVLACNEPIYSKLIEHVYEHLTTETSAAQLHSYLQVVVAVCRSAGQRFGPHLAQFFTVIDQYCTEKDDDDIRELSLQAYESFLSRSPKDAMQFLPVIVERCFTYLTYDPNYNYDDGVGDADNYSADMEIVGSGDEEDEDDELGVYSDDDDMSWKVRRSAAKCLEAVIIAKRGSLPEVFRTISPMLIERFKEREENVKSDIFHVYIVLIRQIKRVPAVEESKEGEIVLEMFRSQMPLLIKTVCVQMKEKSLKTKQDCITLLRELVYSVPGILSDYIGILIPGIQSFLRDKNTNMKIITLVFLNSCFETHPAAVFHPYVHILVPLLTEIVSDAFYKLSAEGLICMEQLTTVIRPLNSPSNFDFSPYAQPIYQCTFNRLRSHDVDLEVKERCISCMAQIVCNLGDILKDELPVCMPIFLDKLRSDITRLVAVKGLSKIAASPLRIDINLILDETISLLASFLRKNHRALKINTLVLLDTLVNRYPMALNQKCLVQVIQELPSLINDIDFHIAQLALTLLSSAAKTIPNIITEEIIDETISLTKSPLLQGAPLQAMIGFFQELIRAKLPKHSFEVLMNKLVEPLKNPRSVNKQAYQSMSKCVCAIAITEAGAAIPTVRLFQEKINEKNDDIVVAFSLRIIGEIGKYLDLSSVENLHSTISKPLSSHSEELKSAASYAVGGIAIGNLETYLPLILNEIETHPKWQYLLFHSIKEVISHLSTTTEGVLRLQPFIPAVWNQLFKYCECSEEGTRNVVAECLGKLTLINPEVLLPQLKEALGSKSPCTKTTILTALKFTISEQPQKVDPLLKENMLYFLSLIEDENVNVRRVALIVFNSAAHNKPLLVRDLLPQLQPKLYAETAVRRELIREVEMGPFKHTIDDGLDMRKAAFECMYTLLDTCLDFIDVYEFVVHLECGLRDHYDIKMLSYLMVARFAQLAPGVVLQNLEKILDPIKQTCLLKVKANSVKQEYEKQHELKKSALRAVAALLHIPEANKNPHLNDFMNSVKSQSDLKLILEGILNNAIPAEGSSFDLPQTPMDTS